MVHFNFVLFWVAQVRKIVTCFFFFLPITYCVQKKEDITVVLTTCLSLCIIVDKGNLNNTFINLNTFQLSSVIHELQVIVKSISDSLVIVDHEDGDIVIETRLNIQVV